MEHEFPPLKHYPQGRCLLKLPRGPSNDMIVCWAPVHLRTQHMLPSAQVSCPAWRCRGMCTKWACGDKGPGRDAPGHLKPL